VKVPLFALMVVVFLLVRQTVGNLRMEVRLTDVHPILSVVTGDIFSENLAG
jgi:hypothetical protein